VNSYHYFYQSHQLTFSISSQTLTQAVSAQDQSLYKGTPMYKAFSLLTLITLSFATKVYGSIYPLSCEVWDRESKQMLEIETDMDSAFGVESGMRKNIQVNGSTLKGYLSSTDGQDENGHGLKYVVVTFGENLTLRATLSPVDYEDESHKLIAQGSANLYQYGQAFLGSGHCSVRSNCDGDSRVCPD
jgi:hypothetical protein